MCPNFLRMLTISRTILVSASASSSSSAQRPGVSMRTTGLLGSPRHTPSLKLGETVQASGSSLTSKKTSESPGLFRMRLRRVDLPSPASPMAAITSLWSGSEGSLTMVGRATVVIYFWPEKRFVTMGELCRMSV